MTNLNSGRLLGLAIAFAISLKLFIPAHYLYAQELESNPVLNQDQTLSDITNAGQSIKNCDSPPCVGEKDVPPRCWPLVSKGGGEYEACLIKECPKVDKVCMLKECVHHVPGCQKRKPEPRPYGSGVENDHASEPKNTSGKPVTPLAPSGDSKGRSFSDKVE